MSPKTYLVLAVLFTGAFMVINLLPIYPFQPAPENAIRGKEVWQARNCISCHTLLGNGGYRGGDLTNAVKNSREKVVDYLVEAPVMWPHKKRKHPALDRDDAGYLADYLEFLSTVPTLGWPPELRKPEEQP